MTTAAPSNRRHQVRTTASRPTPNVSGSLCAQVSADCRPARQPTIVPSPTLRQTRRRDLPDAAICVQKVDVQCVLQFTLLLALSCVLHRLASRVIHRRESSTTISPTSTTKDQVSHTYIIVRSLPHDRFPAHPYLGRSLPHDRFPAHSYLGRSLPHDRFPAHSYLGRSLPHDRFPAHSYIIVRSVPHDRYPAHSYIYHRPIAATRPVPGAGRRAADRSRPTDVPSPPSRLSLCSRVRLPSTRGGGGSRRHRERRRRFLVSHQACPR